MKLSEFTNKYGFINILIKNKGDKELYPPQEKALKSGFLCGKNLLLSSPTSSGKTLIAEIAILSNALKNKKSVYLVPLKSLAVEKYNDFQKTFKDVLNVGISTGDLTTSDEWLKNKDLIICSYEKFDSLMRHNTSWVKDVGLAVFDEVHLMNDAYRGPVIEILLTKLKTQKKWIIGLSATVGNPKKLGKWLNAITITSNFRPVKLLEGIMFENTIKFKNDTLIYKADNILELCKNAINKKKQILIFTNTRRNAESIALKLANFLSPNNTLNELSKKVLNALSSPTQQCEKLASCVRQGVAFNHAGLSSNQKILIEDGFRKNLIKIIACTTVLAYGVSLPAYLVILKDFKRFGKNGMDYISKSEYLQIAGRAGRSGYDEKGESILVINNENEYELAWKEYLCSKPEEIISKLGIDPVLRFYTLALICDGANDYKKINEFFKNTFFGYDYGSDEFLSIRIKSVIEDLVNWGLIKKDKYLRPTNLGKRVNELYIDPLSANKIIKGLKDNFTTLGLLHLAAYCPEIIKLKVKKSEYNFILNELSLKEDQLLIKQTPFDYEFEDYINAFKTALVLNEWINEKGEDYLYDMGITPGTLQRLIKNMEWILYSIGELGEILGINNLKEYITGLIMRVKYGIKSDIILLVNIKGIGRVRARKLYNNGIKTIEDIKKVGINKISKLIGPATASKLFKLITKT